MAKQYWAQTFTWPAKNCNYTGARKKRATAPSNNHAVFFACSTGAVMLHSNVGVTQVPTPLNGTDQAVGRITFRLQVRRSTKQHKCHSISDPKCNFRSNPSSKLQSGSTYSFTLNSKIKLVRHCIFLQSWRQELEGTTIDGGWVYLADQTGCEFLLHDKF